MLESSLVFGFTFCAILSANYAAPQVPSCSQNYGISNQQKLTLELGYDAGMILDTDFAKSMCKARSKFPNRVSLKFVVGYTIKVENGNVLCVNETAEDKSCAKAIEHACASELVNNFSDFCCCTMADKKDSKTCLTIQNQDKLQLYEDCVNLKSTSIKPLDILVTNSGNSQEKYPNSPCAPAFYFNEVWDECARNDFFENPNPVVCALLAANIEPSC